MKLLPKILQIDILRRHLGPFLFVSLTIMFLLLMQFLMMYLDKIVGKGIPLPVIIELILSNLAYMVVLAVPMAVLVSTLMVYGAFSESNEFTAIRASGIHPYKIMSTVVSTGFILFILMVLFSNYILPEANYRARALFLDIRLKKPGFDLKEGVFYDGIEGYTFLVEHKPSDSDSLFGVTLFQEPKNGKDEALIKAERGFLSSQPESQSLKLFLHNGEMFRMFKQKQSTEKTIEKTSFGTYEIAFDLSNLEFSRSNPESRGRNDRTMRAEAMYEVVNTLKEEIINDTRNAYEQNKSIDVTFANKDTLITNVLNLPVRETTKPLGTPRVKKEGFVSGLIALNSLSYFEDQRDYIRSSIRGIRARAINYDGVNNTQKWKEERQAKYWVEIQKKLAIPFGCILFVFIGAPLGLLTKKGNLGVAAVISALIFTLYWIGIIQGEKLADRLLVSPEIGMWGINIIYTIVAIVLMIKINRGKIFRRTSKA
ncbi:YjgP/YjgQ family permease [bacterium]|nr:MAG: YjgP/YjgQ family permease [bacterium]